MRSSRSRRHWASELPIALPPLGARGPSSAHLPHLIVYTAINIFLGHQAWDPYPFILLNLFLSMLAAIQAPVIMMSQNRQDKKDRLRGELDFDVNRRADSEIQGLAHKLNLLGGRWGTLKTICGTKSARCITTWDNKCSSFDSSG